MEISYNYYLVVLSYVIAAYASYGALSISGRLINSHSKRKWLLAGSASMGCGIWSMHFIGMLAYEMSMPMSYDPALTVFSGIIALTASALAMYLIGWNEFTKKRAVIGGIVMGLGISAMHYMGMEAMIMPASISYDSLLFTISILIGIIASISALWIIHFLNSNKHKYHSQLMVIAALIMGVAVCGMHYTGMEAAIYTMVPNKVVEIDNFDNTILIGTITLITLLIITSTLLASLNKKNKHNNNIILLVLTIMTAVTISVGVTIDILYNTAFDTEKKNLSEKIFEYKNLIRSVSQFDSVHSKDAPNGGPRAATISQVKKAHSVFERKIDTNEFYMFEFIDERQNINFLIKENTRHEIFPDKLPTKTNVAQIFVKALDGNSGIVKMPHPISKEFVLSAYAFIPELNVAILSSVNIDEIREPFIEALTYTAFVAFFVILIATSITYGISQPIISSLRSEIETRNKTESELRDMTENLESIVKERTIELEKALIITEDAAKAKSEFLANMSHEIRTPMNGVLGMLQLLNETSLEKDQKDFVITAHNSAETLLTILNDILDFSKIEAGAIELESIDFNLQDTVGDVASLLAESAHKKDLELLTHISTNVPVMIKSDPTRLRQILFNLTNNAIKFTQKGEILISVKLERKSDSGNRIKFEVSDTGIGIPEAAQKKIFEVFKQEDGTTTRKFGGTGLGLAISKKLSEHMGGNLSVQSSEGSGSTFSFSIDSGISKLKPERERDFSTLSGMNVLIVDDNKTNQQILESMLRSWNIVFDSVDDGFQCLEKIKQPDSHYNMILLDMMMPGMNGIEVAQTIQKDTDLDKLKIIMLTSLTHANIQKESKESGISACLHKPIKKSLLLDTIMSTIGDVNDGNLPKIKPVNTDIFSDIKILVAEDNSVNQKVISRMLTFLGFSHHISDNGKDAINELNNDNYSLILMDCQMPVMDGFEATKQLRSEELYCDLPIIAMTANAMEGDKERCISVGMSDYISKPVNKDALLDILKKWTRIKT